jgi:tRNA (adenine57-N1/adenine58-N1)-methyltransferase
MKRIGENDLILIIYKDMRYLKSVAPGKGFHGKGGILDFSSLVGKRYGTKYGQYEVYEPTIEDILMQGLKRETQIVYPKDGFFICFKLNLRYGTRILEVGTGSGAMTVLFSRMVGPEGKVVSFEKEERHYRVAKRNLERFSLWENVELHNEDIADYAGGEFDTAFIDVREPWALLDTVRPWLVDSAPIGTIVPTANQISDTLRGLEGSFGEVEVIELMLRRYKTVAERVRPFDRMVAHTGYLMFARKIDHVVEKVT